MHNTEEINWQNPVLGHGLEVEFIPQNNNNLKQPLQKYSWSEWHYKSGCWQSRFY